MKRPVLLAILVSSLALAAALGYFLESVPRSGNARPRSTSERSPPGPAVAGQAPRPSDTQPGEVDDEVSPVGPASARTSIAAVAGETAAPPLLVGIILEADGSPAMGARVFARTGGWYSIVPLELDGTDGRQSSRQETRTAADGSFAFTEGLEVGADLALSVVHEQHATERMLRIPFRFAPHDVGVLTLRRGLTLVGSVRTADGTPIADADVLLAARRGVAGLEGTFPGQGSSVARTDAAGAFRVDAIAPGPWHLLFDAEGMQVAERSGHEERAQTIDLGSIVLERGHAIEGTIVGIPQEQLKRVRVEARCEDPDFREIQHVFASLRRPRRARPEPNGAFRISGVMPHPRTRVRILAPDEAGGWTPIPEVAQVLVASDATGVELVWGEPLSLRARVVDATGEPIVDYTAFAQLGYFGGTHEIGGEGPGETPTHHPGGELHARGMRLYSEERTPSLMIRAPGYEDYEREIEGLVPGRSIDAGDVVLEKAPLLQVLVHDPNGSPIAGARLELSAEDTRTRSAESDTRGVARLNAVRNAPATLRVTHELWSDARRELEAAGDLDLQLRVELSRGCTLAALVTGRSEATLHGHSLEATRLLSSHEPDPDTRVRESTTDRDGRVEWHGLPAGLWRVRRVPHTREWRSGPVAEAGKLVSLTPDERVEVLLDAPLEAAVRGTLRDSKGVLSTASLRLRPLDYREGKTDDRGAWGSPYSRLTNGFGEFLFERVPHGIYRIEVEHDSRAMVARHEIVVSDDMQALRITLPEATYRVRVVDEAGQPVPNAPVELDAGDSSYGGWNDARSAWTDERGDLQQAWLQSRLNERLTGTDGWAEFEGCVPNVPLTLRLAGRWTTRSSVALEPVPAGEIGVAPEKLVWRAAGDVTVVPTGAASGWRVSCVPLAWDGSPRAGFGRTEVGALEPITFHNIVAGPCRVELELEDDRAVWWQAAAVEITLPARQNFLFDADLGTRTLIARQN